MEKKEQPADSFEINIRVSAVPSTPSPMVNGAQSTPSQVVNATESKAKFNATKEFGKILAVIAVSFIVYFDDLIYHNREKPLVLLAIIAPYVALLVVVVLMTNSARKENPFVYYVLAFAFVFLVIVYYILAPAFKLFKLLWTGYFLVCAILFGALFISKKARADEEQRHTREQVMVHI